MKNHFQHTRFILGTRDTRQAPADVGAEVAFAGRSNAGKSSALNVITGQRSLARISKAPGRTREINYFLIRDKLRLVDLPGYGYAKVSREMQQQWQQQIAYYLENRRSLCGLLLLMDIRHPLRPVDELVLRWCHAANLPTHVLLTKTDKLKRGPAGTALQQVRTRVQVLHSKSSIQLFSALTREGTETTRNVLENWLGFPDIDE